MLRVFLVLDLKKFNNAFGVGLHPMTLPEDHGYGSDEKIIEAMLQRFAAAAAEDLASEGKLSAATGGSRCNFTIPNEKVGLVIGKGGDTINDLRTRSGASIDVSGEPDAEDGTKRTIVISANSDGAVEWAKAQIEIIVKVDEVTEKLDKLHLGEDRFGDFMRRRSPPVIGGGGGGKRPVYAYRCIQILMSIVHVLGYDARGVVGARECDACGGAFGIDEFDMPPTSHLWLGEKKVGLGIRQILLHSDVLVGPCLKCDSCRVYTYNTRYDGREISIVCFRSKASYVCLPSSANIESRPAFHILPFA